MSRLRTGHGPDDWQDQPPAENSHTFKVSGEMVTAQPVFKGISMPSIADIRRAEARKARAKEQK